MRGWEGEGECDVQPADEVELVAAAVVDAGSVAERVEEIGGYLVDGGRVGEGEVVVPLRCLVGKVVEEGAEGGVAEAGPLLI